MPPPEPIRLREIITDMIKGQKLYIHKDDRAGLLFEQFTGKRGGIFWRACLTVNGKVHKHSSREQPDPEDALRELAMICDGGTLPGPGRD